MKHILAFVLLFTGVATNAQFDGLLNRTKDAAQRKVAQKVNEKINEGVDKGAEAIEDLATGKKNRKSNREKQNSGRREVPDEPAAGAAFESRELVFQTSITTVAAKEKMENILREADGVSSVSVDSDTGVVYVTPSSGKDITGIIQDTIKKYGFSAKVKSNRK